MALVDDDSQDGNDMSHTVSMASLGSEDGAKVHLVKDFGESKDGSKTKFYVGGGPVESSDVLREDVRCDVRDGHVEIPPRESDQHRRDSSHNRKDSHLGVGVSHPQPSLRSCLLSRKSLCQTKTNVHPDDLKQYKNLILFKILKHCEEIKERTTEEVLYVYI